MAEFGGEGGELLAKGAELFEDPSSFACIDGFACIATLIESRGRTLCLFLRSFCAARA
jgi:hypothetical protein